MSHTYAMYVKGHGAERHVERSLLNVTWKDILLVPHAWYPDHLNFVSVRTIKGRLPHQSTKRKDGGTYPQKRS